MDRLISAVPTRMVHEDRNLIQLGVVKFGLEGNLFSCKMKDCLNKMIKQISEQEMMISLTASMIVSKYKKYKCDYCHRLSAKIHRCTACSTKLYCQQDCIEGDYLNLIIRVGKCWNCSVQAWCLTSVSSALLNVTSPA